jgi:hypothetical protein
MSKKTTIHDDDDWEPVEVDTEGLSALLTIRFTQPEFRQLRDLAKASRSSMADIVRQAVRDRLSSATSSVRTMGWTIHSHTIVRAESGQVTVGNGRQHGDIKAGDEAA